MRWRDGWSLWHIHGVAVDEQIVMRPETQTLAQIQSEQNAEVRRIRIERFGWIAYLRAAGARVLDRRCNEIDQNHEALLESSDGARVLVCACPSTARMYAMRVPREIKNCTQAQSWLAGDRPIRIVGAS